MHKLIFVIGVLPGLLGAACASPPVPQAVTAAPVTRAPAATAPTSERVEAAPAGAVRERAELRTYFKSEGVGGTIALFDSADGVLSCSDVARCSKGVLPASTFKIANTMIALETGVVEDAETVLPWDGKHYQVEAWNRDHTLRSAIHVSCVPCFQAIARQVGPARMSEWLNRLDYGNHQASGGIDRFWLSGGLRISPLQEVDFLRRFESGKLPLSPRTAEIVRDVITLDVGRDYVLRGKTGLVKPLEAPLAAWFVGWLELGERRVFFATLIDEAPADLDLVPLRRKLTERVLAEIGVLPSDATRTQGG